MSDNDAKLDEFLMARGGPFYDLQKQLGLLRENAFHAGSRALLFIGLAWGIPLILSIIEGNAYGPAEENPYLLSLAVWARFFIAVGLFILMERKVEQQLSSHLRQFARAPLLAPDAFEPAAGAVTKALKWRDARSAEIVCLIIAALISFATMTRFEGLEQSSWAVNVHPDGNVLSMAGWWCVIISNPVFWFLLLRWLWRLFLWARLLRDLAGLELRLVATHPDGNGGLAFIGEYPNAYSTFIFAVGCVLGAGIANGLMDGSITATTYGYTMAVWLVIVLLLFAYPLLAFRKPLGELKKRTILACSAQATRQHRAAERELLGKNICAVGDAEPDKASEILDPSKTFAASQKLSGLAFSRHGLLPVSVAAVLPLIAAGATTLPLKDIIKVAKRLLLL